MKVYPLKSMTVEQAQEKQFKLVDCLTRNLDGQELLSRGDLGVNKLENKPVYTSKIEKAIAQFFDAQDALFVRGAGTGAIRYGLAAIANSGDKILIHDAPVYATTQTTIEMFGLKTVCADFNNLEDIKEVLEENKDIKAALVQHSRQLPEDSYDLAEVIKAIKDTADIPVLVDDNYAAMKVEKIGCQLNADLSCFSCFKLLGPEGIGLVVGNAQYIAKIKKMHYSGGTQVQGHEALDAIRGLIYAPVQLAISANELENVLARIGEVKGVKDAYIANAQSKVLLVELEKPIAQKVIEEAVKRGALPNPVGSESKYELTPLFYKASGTFLKQNPELIDTMVRINPNRAGADTIIRIISESVEAASK